MEAATKPKPDRAAIRTFLRAALANGAVPVRDLESRARAAGLLAEGLALSQCMPIRTAAGKLKVLRYREDDRWWWRLPSTKMEDDVKMIETALETEPVAEPPPSPSVQDDLAAARRKFVEERLCWYHSDEARAAAQKGREQAERYLETGRLEDLFPTEH
jgi:hypothetical protein